MNVLLAPGNFVRVKAVSETKAGADGMVVKDFGDSVGLIFGYDRHCQPQHLQCVGTELWEKHELDLSTVD